MPLVDINRPGIIVRNVIDELKRWTKHSSENTERINNKFYELPAAYQTFTHGTQQEVPNPFYPSVPTGFLVTNTSASTSPSISFTPVTRSGFCGITANFARPAGVVDLLRAATQSIPSATSTPIQWTSDELSLTLVGTTATSGAFSYDYTTTTGTPPTNSKITCLSSGFVLVTASGGFAANATGLREFWLVKNNATTPRWADTLYQSPPVTTDIRFNLSAVIQVTAGDYLQLYCYQDSGGALNTLAGTVSRFQARYVDVPTTYSGTVQGYLLGP